MPRNVIARLARPGAGPGASRFAPPPSSGVSPLAGHHRRRARRTSGPSHPVQAALHPPRPPCGPRGPPPAARRSWRVERQGHPRRLRTRHAPAASALRPSAAQPAHRARRRKAFSWPTFALRAAKRLRRTTRRDNGEKSLTGQNRPDRKEGRDERRSRRSRRAAGKKRMTRHPFPRGRPGFRLLQWQARTASGVNMAMKTPPRRMRSSRRSRPARTRKET